MINGKEVFVVLPAYNAASTLHKTVAEIDRRTIDQILLVDDCSTDSTIEQAGSLGLPVISHDRNKGYGANQKTCYRRALELGADVVVMLHPDYQYSPKLVVAMSAMIAYGEYDLVLASRILGRGVLKGGMPVYKFVANRILTLVENLIVSYKLTEYHSGYRAFSREVLSSLSLEKNSDSFVFDNQIILQALTAGFRIGELSCPTRYTAESSSINLPRSIGYGVGVLRSAVQYRLHASGLHRSAYLEPTAGPVAPSSLPTGDGPIRADVRG